MKTYAKELRQLGSKTLGIIWSDGHNSIYQVRNLRLACRCASCVDEITSKKKLRDEDVPENIHPRTTDSVGRYALNFHWSDGHTTGIYTFEHLRTLCECPQCRKSS